MGDKLNHRRKKKNARESQPLDISQFDDIIKKPEQKQKFDKSKKKPHNKNKQNKKPNNKDNKEIIKTTNNIQNQNKTMIKRNNDHKIKRTTLNELSLFFSLLLQTHNQYFSHVYLIQTFFI